MVFYSIFEVCWWVVVMIMILGYGDMVLNILGKFKGK